MPVPELLKDYFMPAGADHDPLPRAVRDLTSDFASVLDEGGDPAA
jgi:hypothetical protein